MYIEEEEKKNEKILLHFILLQFTPNSFHFISIYIFKHSINIFHFLLNTTTFFFINI